MERVHRLRRPQGIPMEIPRDIIARFENCEGEKNDLEKYEGKATN